MASPPDDLPAELAKDPAYAALIAAARQALQDSTQKHPRDAITTLDAVREGRVLSWLVGEMPAVVRPTLRRMIADFDRDTLPVPVWDVVREPPPADLDPRAAGCAAYRGPDGLMHLSAPVFRGRFSKFRLAMEADGTLLGAKQMHCDRNVADDPPGERSKHPLTTLPMAMIVREVLMMDRLATATRPTRVLRCGADVYVVMPLLPFTLPALRVTLAPMAGAGRYVALGAAAAIAHCHQAGYVHADVKLDNILCSQDGRLALCDFAMATQMGADKIAAAQRGTPHDSAPEIVSALPFTGAVDIWSLGILLLELHAGLNVNPFAPATLVQAADRWEHARQQHAAFAQWRNETFGQGLWDAPALQRAAAASNPWADFIRPCAAADAGLAMVILRHMLAPDAEQRATAAQLQAMLSQLPDPGFTWPTQLPRDRDRAKQTLALNIVGAREHTAQKA